MPKSRAQCVVIVFLGCLSSACADREPIAEEAVSRPGLAVGTVTMVPVYSIGGSDEDGTPLWAPSAISVAGERVFILDRGFATVRVFSKDGTQIQTLGSRGQGPGEFQVPTGMAASTTAVYVSELGNRRLHAFSADDGELIYTKEIPVNVYGQMRARDDGTLFAGVLTTEQYPDGTPRPGVATFSPDGALVGVRLVPDESLPPPVSHIVRGTTSGGAAGRVTFRAPFEPETVWNVSTQGGIILGSGSDYRLELVGPEGGTSTIIGPDDVGAAAVLPGEAAWHAAWISAKIQQSLPDYRWPVENVMTEKPYFTGIFSDNLDRLWVARPTGSQAVEDCDETFSTPQQVRQPRRCWEDELAFDLFSAGGEFIRTIAVPNEVSLSPAPVVPVIAIADDVVWVRTRRADGNEMITGYELRGGD